MNIWSASCMIRTINGFFCIVSVDCILIFSTRSTLTFAEERRILYGFVFTRFAFPFSSSKNNSPPSPPHLSTAFFIYLTKWYWIFTKWKFFKFFETKVSLLQTKPRTSQDAGRIINEFLFSLNDNETSIRLPCILRPFK